MSEYKILFPVDLSESSVKIYPQVKKVAEKCRAQVYLTYVSKIAEYYVEGEEYGKSLKEKMEAFKKKYIGDAPNVKIFAEVGEPAEKILETVEKEGIDMIVMAPHGKKVLGKVLVGSVASAVIREATVPVLLVNPFLDKTLN